MRRNGDRGPTPKLRQDRPVSWPAAPTAAVAGPTRPEPRRPKPDPSPRALAVIFGEDYGPRRLPPTTDGSDNATPYLKSVSLKNSLRVVRRGSA